MTAPTADHQVRRDRLRAALRDAGVDAALITDLVNIRYLTGFSGSNGALLVPADGPDVFSTDGRYTEQAAEETPSTENLIDKRPPQALLARAGGGGAAMVGFEAHHVSVEDHQSWVDAHSSLDLKPLGHLVEDLRRVKDEHELALLREACAVGDRALAELLGWLRVGQTEREVMRRLESLMFDHGAEALSFDSIVAGGPHSSIPHHQPTDRPIGAGDFLKLDFGAAVGGYHADMTRTLVVGAPPADWQRETYDLVAAAQAAGRAALVPGTPLAAVDAAARSVIEAAGLGDLFPHGLGHGVGLVIHEDPFFEASATGTLEAGSPVTVEPGVYHPGRGGVRIEDTLVVTDGTPELLTTSTKELLVVGV